MTDEATADTTARRGVVAARAVPARRAHPGRHADRAHRPDDRPVRHGRDRRPAPGRAASRAPSSPASSRSRTATRAAHPRRGGRRRLVRDERRLHPARGRRAHRRPGTWPARSRPSSTTASGCSSATWFYPATALICGVVGLAIGSSWTTAATLGVAFVALAPLLGRQSGHHRRGRHLGRLLRRQDDADLRDDGPRAVDGRRRDDPGARRRDDLDVRAGDRDRARRCSRSSAWRRRRRAPRSTRRSAQATLAGEFWISRINLLPLVLLVVLSLRRAPPFLSIFGCALFAGVAGLLHAARARRGVRRRAGPGCRCVTGHRGHLHGDGQRVRVEHRQRRRSTRCSRAAAWTRMLTTIWLVLGRPELRRDHGGRRLPRAADPAGRRAREVDRAPHRVGRRHVPSASTSSRATSTWRS